MRYDVIGTEALAPGEVQVKFGHAVYLPTPGESILYKVSTSQDSAIWQDVCPMYLNQRLALIGHDAELASHAAPGWPFGADGAVLLVNDGPDAPIEVQVRPKGAFDCSFDAAAGHYAITRRGNVDASGAPVRLLLKVERVGAAKPAPAPVPMPAPAAKPAAVWKTRSPTTVPESEQTAVPFSHRPHGVETDATFAPVALQRVCLVGLALPRLSRYRDTGATGIEIGLDRALAIAGEDDQTAIRFAVDEDDQLHAITSAGRQPIDAPASFTPIDSGRVDLLAVAPEMAERYCAVLLLPHQAGVPVASGARLVFGRSAPMLATLRVLDSPRFLERADGAPGASADRLGLSRNAFSFEAAASGYKIGRMSATQALFHLDADLGFVGSIGSASADQPYLLPHGHHLVAGHYVLRFDA